MPPRARGPSAGGTLAMRQQQHPPAAATAAAQQQQAKAVAATAAARAAVQADVLYNPANWKNNYQAIYYLRTYMTVVAGVVAGILGITDWLGFVVYLASQMLCVPLILLKCGGAGYGKYFPSWDKVVLEHVFSSTAVLSYVLCWMVGYNLCYVF